MFTRSKILGRPSLLFWLLTGFLILVAATGGTAAAESQSLILLRPIALLMCAYALWTIEWSHLVRYRGIFPISAAVVVLPIIHLLPLPPSVWHALPGRQIVIEVDHAFGYSDLWRPISMAPWATWNALFALAVPLAVLLLGIQLNARDRDRLLIPILAFGLISGFCGLLQAAGARDLVLYPSVGVQEYSVAGLFSNRNHAAVLLGCMFPLLATFSASRYVSEGRRRYLLLGSIVLGAILIALITVTGSRSGLVLGAIGLVSFPFVRGRLSLKQGSLQSPRKAKRNLAVRAAIALSAICLPLIALLFLRAQAFERLSALDPADELRFQVWKPIADMGWKYFPIGSGVGTFVEAYQVDEPFALLRPEYLNHAHNDYLEIWMTAGVPGTAILLLVALGLATRCVRAWCGREEDFASRRLARAASVVVTVLGLASVTDYPMRTPALASLFVLAVLWLISLPDVLDPASSKKDGSGSRAQLPR